MVRRNVDRGVGEGIDSGGVNDVFGRVESGDYGEVVLEAGGEVFSRYESSVGKYEKSGVNVIIADSVGWVIDRSVGVNFFRLVDEEVIILKVEFVWSIYGNLLFPVILWWGLCTLTLFLGYFWIILHVLIIKITLNLCQVISLNSHFGSFTPFMILWEVLQ